MTIIKKVVIIVLISVKKTDFRLKKEKKMNKRLSLYQIFMVAMTTIIAAMLVAMGVIAINKSMTLKLGLKMDPAMLCAIYVNDNLVFNNKTSEIASGVSLSANELRLNSTNTFGTYFNLKIENLNEFAINISLSGCTVDEVEGYETAILPKKDTGNIEISSAGLITITMTEAEVYYVQYNANNGGGEMATSTHIIGTSSALSANAFTAPSEDVEFAGWATTLTDAQNGVVAYEEGDVILNLGTTDGQTIQLYAVWKMKGYKVTFATNNWAATYEGEEVDSSLVVEPNGNLTVRVAGSGTQDGYSVHSSPTITGTITSSTFDRYTGTLTLTNIQSDLTISATDFRPWTYGKYVSTYTSDTEPAIGTIVSGTDVYYPAFNGYKYVIFANHETQENNFYISTPGDMAARWIMIGASESLDSEIFAGVTKPEGAATTTNLLNSQVLLLSEYVLASMQYNTTNTPTVTTRFETNTRTRAIEHAIVQIKVADNAGRFTTASNTAMTLLGQAITYHHIFGRLVHAQSVFGATGLHGETVVATTERTIFNQDIAGRFDIDTVAAGNAHRTHGNPADDNAVAIHRHHVPHRRTFQSNTFDEHILTIGRRHKSRKKHSLTLLVIEQT